MSSGANLMLQPRSLPEIADLLVSQVYVGLSDMVVDVVWGSTGALADIACALDKRRMRIRVNREAGSWPEPAIIGLLAHELSHPAQTRRRTTEQSTDADTVDRGLGVYLAVERLVAGQYEDMCLRRGHDRYLGYRTVRSLLTDTERDYLERLLQKLNLAPRRGLPRTILTHDISLAMAEDSSVLALGGHRIETGTASSQPDIKLLLRDERVLVYVDETLRAELDVEDFPI